MTNLIYPFIHIIHSQILIWTSKSLIPHIWRSLADSTLRRPPESTLTAVNFDIRPTLKFCKYKYVKNDSYEPHKRVVHVNRHQQQKRLCELVVVLFVLPHKGPNFKLLVSFMLMMSSSLRGQAFGLVGVGYEPHDLVLAVSVLNLSKLSFIFYLLKLKAH